MAMKPKARKYRLRRGGATDGETGVNLPPPDLEQAIAKDAVADLPDPKANKTPSTPPTSAEKEIEAIKAEGLTWRQLRLARRVAQKHDIVASSDHDAVRLLRQKGIDPFKRSNMLELVVPRIEEVASGGDDADQTQREHLPQTIPTDQPSPPSTDLSPAPRRDLEIGAIQRDMMRRRRRKLLLLLSRLGFFVLLPTLLAGLYFYKFATPMHAAQSEFLILKADNGGGQG
jgi:capsular polysaccharide transport system permease protein